MIEADSLRTLGSLNPFPNNTLAHVNKRKFITAHNFADFTGAEINSARTKLLNLHKARLVIRTYNCLSEQGRQYVYKSLNEMLLGRSIHMINSFKRFIRQFDKRRRLLNYLNKPSRVLELGYGRVGNCIALRRIYPV